MMGMGGWDDTASKQQVASVRVGGGRDGGGCGGSSGGGSRKPKWSGPSGGLAWVAQTWGSCPLGHHQDLNCEW
ncbi:hypothetical protein E2C01_098070 [Portunus trituberculatus]|uniref:Uncharacterized protein n=1 Tax=Portunus trituberculatus TaxID=210409 RepID=A0A5B7K213_PORTR|nr:hypothetical protein [Portunus trituberculatus]